MDKINKIRLKTKFENNRFLELNDILKEIDNGSQFQWAILDFDAFHYTGEAMLIAHHIKDNIFEKKIIPISWKEIHILAKGVGQFINLILIGCKDPKKLQAYQDDDEMLRSCDIVIIMFDTSWWEIACKDNNLMKKFINTFGRVIN